MKSSDTRPTGKVVVQIEVVKKDFDSEVEIQRELCVMEATLDRVERGTANHAGTQAEAFSTALPDGEKDLQASENLNWVESQPCRSTLQYV